MLHASTTQYNPQMMQSLQDCIRNCLDCSSICQQCAAECIAMEKPGMGQCIALCMDCAAICTLDAELMSRESQYHFSTCELCAAICEDCAEMCEGIAPGESNTLQECAEVCRRCAASCQLMASMESSGEVGQVNISEATYAQVMGVPGLTFIRRGKVSAKGKGELEMYFVRHSGSEG